MVIRQLDDVIKPVPVPVRMVAGIAVSNPGECMDVRLLCVCCAV